MADRPLWEVMHSAYLTELAENPHAELAEVYQSMIRAIADEVVPEEPEPFTPELPLDQRWKSLLCCGYHQRQHIRQRLLAEADRAEAGKVE
jgi:hypothetical protein